jgi:pimeloyl-ACP methyl ester carboxylesterase
MKTFHLKGWDAHLRYHDLPGPGLPLVFVHGFGCASSCDFPRVAADPGLGPRRRLLVDLLGSGFSDAPAGFSYAMEAHARCLDDLLEGLQLLQVDLYGHSMGGAVAIELAALRPGRVRRLVLSEPALDPAVSSSMRAIAGQSEAEYVSRGQGALVRAALQEGNPIWAGTLGASAAHAIHREAVARCQGRTPTWRALLESLEVPRHVLFGGHSLPHPDFTGLPGRGMRVDTVPGAGHSMMWENPAGLARALRRALA